MWMSTSIRMTQSTLFSQETEAIEKQGLTAAWTTSHPVSVAQLDKIKTLTVIGNILYPYADPEIPKSRRRNRSLAMMSLNSK